MFFESHESFPFGFPIRYFEMELFKATNPNSPSLIVGNYAAVLLFSPLRTRCAPLLYEDPPDM